ncbi:Cox19-like chch family protein [Thalictrum thalictroides]|uniref:Cox19-like chch family protein n=1 Tax=Thalictrum thalictroides TaxID=46969 RepID=A0A7J6WSS5_THATH|nr:Cox19-like chch family protein [Thalictrum thalictroides]
MDSQKTNETLPLRSPSSSMIETQHPLHQDDADEEDENVKQLKQCSVLYLSLQDCLIEKDRNWKACQFEVQALKACHEKRNKDQNSISVGQSNPQVHPLPIADDGTFTYSSSPHTISELTIHDAGPVLPSTPSPNSVDLIQDSSCTSTSTPPGHVQHPTITTSESPQPISTSSPSFSTSQSSNSAPSQQLIPDSRLRKPPAHLNDFHCPTLSHSANLIQSESKG